MFYVPFRRTTDAKNKSIDIFIHIASFYSVNTAKFLKQRIIKEVPEYDSSILKKQKVLN